MCQLLLQMFSQLYGIFFKSPRGIDNIDAEEMHDKIATMEGKITHLEEQNKDLQNQLDYNRNKEAALQKVLCNYDNLLRKVVMEKNTNSQQDETTLHLANLETAFYDLLQKYEKAKLIVQGFQQNETLLKKQVEEYEDILDNLRLKFATYKSCSENRLEIKNELGVKKTKSCEGKKRRLLTTI